MGAYSDRVIADGASNYWRLGEASGLSAVDIVGGKHGTISGGVTLSQPSPLGDGTSAMRFDGVDDKIATAAGAITLGTGSVSLECWFKTTVAGGAGWPMLIDGCLEGNASFPGLTIRVTNTPAIYAQAYKGDGTNVVQAAWSIPYADGVWHHVVAVVSRGTPDTLLLYGDGVMRQSAAFPTAGWSLTSAQPFVIGNSVANGCPVNASIDEVAIYPRALSASEIAAHYTVSTVPEPRDLNTGLYTYLLGIFGLSSATSYAERVKADGATNHWRLGETSGTSAVDAIGGANGTISGGVTLNQPSAMADGNGAMLFNGTTGKIVTAAVTLPATVTVEAWLKGADANERPVVVLGSSQAPKFGTTANKLYFYDFTSGIGLTGATAMSPGWHHAVYVGDGAGVRLYLDGVLDGTVSGVRSAQSGVVGVGYDAAFAPADLRGFWLGSLDDVSIYPRALTANEIAAHYSLGRSGLSGGNDLTTLITRYLATLTGDMTARWKQMEKNAGF